MYYLVKFPNSKKDWFYIATTIVIMIAAIGKPELTGEQWPKAEASIFYKLSLLYMFAGCGLILASIKRDKERMSQLRFTRQIEPPDSYVYLVRRKRDGIYKIGKTDKINARLEELQKEYGALSLARCWRVGDRHELEKTALDMTKQYTYKEKGRRELRQMTNNQARHFAWDFSIIAKGE